MVKERIKTSLHELDDFEELAQIGSFEVNLVDYSWSASRNFYRMFGFINVENFTIQDFKSVVHRDFFETALLKFNECLQTNQNQRFECLCVDAYGRLFPMECRLQLQQDEDGNPLKLQGMLQNITGRTANEKKVNDLMEMNKIKDEVLAVVAHDLKSPINQIGGMLHLLRMKEDSSNKEFLTYIENACGIASNIINDLIETAEMAEPGFFMNKTLVNINDVVKATVAHYQFKAKEKNVEIKCSLSENVIALFHPSKISRVLDNLLSNAIKFSYSNRSIYISTDRQGDKIIIRVKDVGIGISPEKLPFIFDRFTSAKQTGTKGEKSTGLGLSIAKNIVALHNGKIRVKSMKGEGSEFIVELPA